MKVFSAPSNRLLHRPILLWAIAGIGVAGAYLALLSRLMISQDYNEWGGLVIAPALVGISIALLIRFTRRHGDTRMTGLLIAAMLFKLVGALVRYYVVFSVYGGNDSVGYHDWGVKLAPLIRGGDFAVTIPTRLVGTGFIDVLTGWVYALTGPSIVGGYLVYSWLGFWGLYLFYRAFRIAFPEGDFRRYALLLFFLPSLLFWSSSIGKEAWMTLTLGIVAYGAARVLAHIRGGLPILILGMVGTLMVRPHVTLVAFLAFFAAYLVRPAKRPTMTSPVSKVAGVVVLVLGGALVLSQVETFFGVDKLDSTSVDAVLARTTEQSSQGGSEVDVEQVSGPLGFANAAVAVVFRPWPFEAHNGMSALASLEGVLLLGVLVASGRRLTRLPRALFSVPYVTFAAVFCIGFIFAFSSVGNFGIMVRQRVQLYPFFFVLLALPALMEPLSNRTDRTRAVADPRIR